MAYSSYKGKPTEYASKSSHSYIINDSEVLDFISKCKIPQENTEISIFFNLIHQLQRKRFKIRYVIAIDGGYTPVYVKKQFPSSELVFFQFGVLLFNLEHLNEVEEQPFISPEDIAKLKNLERIKFILPVKNIIDEESNSFKEFVRKTIYNFFLKKMLNGNLIETLKWLIYREFEKSTDSYILATHPMSEKTRIELKKSELKENYTFEHDDGLIYLTDVFRLHEVIDEELGAGGIVGYLLSVIEQLLAVHIIKYIYKMNPNKLEEILFILDRPLAFQGQTANLHKPVRELINYLQDKYNLYIVGLEKNGAFVEHAYEIVKAEKLKKGEYLLLSNDYIYSYILPGKASEENIYGRTTYYSGKIIFYTKDGNINVCSIPIKNSEILLNPRKEEYKNLEEILTVIEDLKCDMFDNALLPITLVNKLISLSDYPSTAILEKFVSGNI